MNHLITVLLLFRIAQPTFSQYNTFIDSNYTIGDKYKGYVVLNSGDTVKGYIQAKKLHKNQNTVYLYQWNGSFSFDKAYSTKTAKAYSFKGLTYKKVEKVKDVLFTKDRFLLYKEGTGIETYFYFNYNDSIFKLNKNNYLNKNTIEKIFPYKTYYVNLKNNISFENQLLFFRFKKKMPLLTIGYNELINKISKKEKGYRYTDLDKIIKEYNTWYITNK